MTVVVHIPDCNAPVIHFAARAMKRLMRFKHGIAPVQMKNIHAPHLCEDNVHIPVPVQIADFQRLVSIPGGGNRILFQSEIAPPVVQVNLNAPAFPAQHQIKVAVAVHIRRNQRNNGQIGHLAVLSESMAIAFIPVKNHFVPVTGRGRHNIQIAIPVKITDGHGCDCPRRRYFDGLDGSQAANLTNKIRKDPIVVCDENIKTTVAVHVPHHNVVNGAGGQ